VLHSQVKLKALRAFAHLQQIFQQNFSFIFWVLFFNYITVAWSLWHTKHLEVILLYGFFLFLGLTSLSALLQLIPYPRIRKTLWACLLLGSGIFWGLESFAIYNYKALIGAGIINALLETNSQEALEFIKMYIGLQGISCILVTFVIFFLVWKYHFLARIKISRKRQSRILLVLCSVSIIATLRMFSSYEPLFENGALDLPLQRGYAATETAIRSINAYEDLSSKVNSDIELTENNGKIPNIVFILGEATNRNHMHLYGYNLPNTPNLDALKAKNEIAVFTDCISPHSTTIDVLRTLFTFCDYESNKDWYEYHNLIDVMNAAGYKTHWLSNQESSGIWGNVAQLYANRSTVHEFTRMRDSREDFGSLDEELFPMLDEAIQQKSSKNFYVLHLMGGHSLYYSRFPYSFSRFSKNDITANVSDEKKVVLAQYANALYYNDYIVSGLIDKFRDTDALVIYVPDHGETIYDEGSNFAGHVEENPNRYMLEIPMIIWASDKFKEKYPEKWQQIQAAVNRPYMTDDLIHTILDLADIKTPEFNPAKSIVNPYFDATRKRMNQGRDYDTQIKRRF